MKLLMRWTWSVTGTENDGSDETSDSAVFEVSTCGVAGAGVSGGTGAVSLHGQL